MSKKEKLTSDVFKLVAKNLQPYKGTTDPTRWLRRIDMLCDIYNLPPPLKEGEEEDKLDKETQTWRKHVRTEVACFLLDEDPQRWLEGCDADDLEWDEFKDALKKRFKKKVSKATVLLELYELSINDTPNRDIQELADKIQEVANTSEKKIDSEDLKTILMHALPEQYHTLLFNEDEEDTFDDLVQKCIALNAIKGVKKKTIKNPRGEATSEEKPNNGRNNDASGNKGNKHMCPYCKKMVKHKPENCYENPSNKTGNGNTAIKQEPTRKNVCYYCGETGHFAKECKKRLQKKGQLAIMDNRSTSDEEQHDESNKASSSTGKN